MYKMLDLILHTQVLSCYVDFEKKLKLAVSLKYLSLLGQNDCIDSEISSRLIIKYYENI